MKKFFLLGKEIAGTILEEILNVSPEEVAILAQELEKLPVPEGITVFGEMTGLEKKILALIDKKEQMLREKIDANSGAAFFAMLGVLSLNDDDSDVDSLDKTLLEIGELERDVEFLHSLVDLLLFGRLGIRKSISIRAGFKVTQVVKDKDDDESCKTSHEAEEHVCAKCSDSDTCPISPYRTGK